MYLLASIAVLYKLNIVFCYCTAVSTCAELRHMLLLREG